MPRQQRCRIVTRNMTSMRFAQPDQDIYAPFLKCMHISYQVDNIIIASGSCQKNAVPAVG